MRYLSLFSGIEAASVAWIPLGWTCVGVAEVEPFPCAVLKHRYPDVPNLGDINKITRQQIEAIGHIDVIVLGFPCQDVSVAGNRQGFKNADGTLTRSGLFFVAMRIIEWSKARWTVGENVPGLFSANEGRDFASVVGELSGAEIDVPGDGWRTAGVALGPLGLVEWFVLDAQYTRVASHLRAVPQRRRRVFIIRDTGDWQGRPPLFLVRESLFGNPAPRREARQRPAPTLAARTRGGGGLGTDFDCDGGLIESEVWSAACAHRLCAHAAKGGDPTTDNYVTHALTGEGFDASEDGSGRGTPIIAFAHQQGGSIDLHKADDVALALQSNHGQAIAFSCKDHGADAGEVAPTLRSMGHSDSHANGGGQMAVAFDTTQITSKANRSNPKDGDPCHPITSEGHPPAIAIQDGRSLSKSQNGCGVNDDGAGYTIDTTGAQAVMTLAIRGRDGKPDIETREDGTANAILTPNGGRAGIGVGAICARMAVRRLTPRECERLQGFPDDYTRIPSAFVQKLGIPVYALDPENAKHWAAGGPRYKALGNSMAVNCMRWIGERIEQVSKIPTT